MPTRRRAVVQRVISSPDESRSSWLVGGASIVVGDINNDSSGKTNVLPVDTPTKFLATSPERSQPPAADLFAADSLHLNTKGYANWTDAVTSAIERASLRRRTVPDNPLHPIPGSRTFIDFGPGEVIHGEHAASPDGNGNHWNNCHAVSASPSAP